MNLMLLDGGFNPFAFTPGAAIWTWAAFLLALPVMWKFVFGPITRALDERDSRVEDAIAAAEQARADAQAQADRSEAALEKARIEAREMVAEATARAKGQAQEELRKAREEAYRQIQKARQEIDAQKRRALEEIRSEVVQLAVGSARRILDREVDEAANRKVVDDFLSTTGGGSRGR